MIFSALSGLLLTLSFPCVSFGFLAWFSLIPLFYVLTRAQSRFQAILYGLVTSLIFFACSLYWIIYVTPFGWIALLCLETFSFLIFSVAVYEGRGLKNSLLRIFWMALAWSACELIRAEMPIFGFGWNLLAYSQAQYLWILQSANTVGAYGLGFMIAFVNACGVEMIGKMNPNASSRKFSIAGLSMLLVLIFTLLLGHGFYHFNRKNAALGSLRVSVLQGNIPQILKWEPTVKEKIIKLYTDLTELAAFEMPDLIVWPEAAFPGYFNKDKDGPAVLDFIRTKKIPAIVGSPHFEAWDKAFNSAYLIGPEGDIQDRYDKMFLVPFGEYVPLKPLLGWLEPIAYSLGVSDFSAGKNHTVFKLPQGISFSVLICFEDIFPNLGRAFVDRGANFLAVITNDAWFGRSSAPYQHLQASIFRAVENGVPVVRAANTGISAFVSKKGVVLDRVQDEKGQDIFVFGKKTLTIPLEIDKTLYRQGGYLFPYVALALFVIMLPFLVLHARKNPGARTV